MSQVDPEERRRQIRYFLLAVVCVLVGLLVVEILGHSKAFGRWLSDTAAANQGENGQMAAAWGIGLIVTGMLLALGYLFIPDHKRRK